MNFWDNIKRFKKDEFDCPCCGANKMNEAFVVMLESARDMAGIPFVVNSGFRCEKHNREVGGKDTSDHLFGLAADIRVRNSTEREKIDTAAVFAGIGRRGIAKTFIHLGGVRLQDGKVLNPQNVLWLYGDE